MRIELQSGGLRLPRGQSLKVLDGAGSTVRALEGSVWITEENMRRDVVREPGNTYRLRNRGLAILHALGGDAAVTLN